MRHEPPFHGIYLPLITPFTDTGELDAGSPADGIKVIEAKAGAVYKTVGAEEKFRSVRYPDVGHTYTPEMRREAVAFLRRWL